jgi:histidyl-tRNA synthetase
MSGIIEPRVLKGFRDFLPDQESSRKRVRALLEEGFVRHGFVPIDTPILEYTEVLLGKGGGDTDKQVYRFQDHGDRDVAMRFDLTVPFARFMAQHRSELYLPFRRYHIDKVFRGENTQRGRYREFVQCDFDVVGVDNASADFEILLLMVRSLEALSIPAFTIHVSHRGLLRAFLAKIEHSAEESEVLRTLDKLPKVGEDKTKESLTALTDAQSAEALLAFCRSAGSWQDTFVALKSHLGSQDPALERLGRIFAAAQKVGIEDRLVLDPAITRGLDYYTGVVFETFLDTLPGIGSVCSGGRYNDLAGLYTKEHLPGVGSSIGLDRLLAALEELGVSRFPGAAPAVLVLCLDEALIPHYHALSEVVRSLGLGAEVYPEAKKLPQQYSYADSKGIPYGIVCDAEAAAAGRVHLRLFSERRNVENLTIEEAAAEVAKGTAGA